MVPASYVWTNGSADFLASTAANWTETSGGPSAVPGPGDYMYFRAASGGLPGTVDGCFIDTGISVDRVIMESSYTGTFTMNTGIGLVTNNYFQQYGSMVLNSGSSNTAGTFFDIHGGVATASSGSTPAILTTTGSLFLSGSITATGMGPDLSITSSGFDAGGTITVGSSGMGADVLITGTFVQIPFETITVNTGSTLTFLATSTSSTPVLEGTIALAGTMTSTNSSGAIKELGITGELQTVGAFAVLSGDVGVYNSGTMNIGTTTAASILTHTAGSLTIGAPDSTGSPTGGTLNVNKSSALVIPSAAASSTFIVTSQGVMNMYGATVSMNTTRVSALEIESGTTPGELNIYGAAGSPPLTDFIYGDFNSAGTITMNSSLTVYGDVSIAGDLDMYGATLTANSTLLTGTLTTYNGTSTADAAGVMFGAFTNNGTLRFAGSLHTFFIFGNYVQGSSGRLEMRLAEGELSDTLSVTGSATIDGTLALTGSISTANQIWNLIDTSGSVFGNFSTFDWPDNTFAWTDLPPGLLYQVSNPP